jgi:DNA-binding GntR family transcriptional regulator
MTAPPVERRKETIASRLSARLRASILRGELEPGSKINLDRLREAHRVSLSPMREAVARLVPDGLVEFEDQKGYRVTPISRRNLEEITRLRCDLEVLALRYSIANGELAWESELIGALHRLNRTDRRIEDPASVEAWEAAHTAFHHQLIRACGMPMLLQFCLVLQNQNDRYRRIFLWANIGEKTVREEHAAIAEAAVARQSDAACDALRRHVERTGRNLMARLDSAAPEYRDA